MSVGTSRRHRLQRAFLAVLSLSLLALGAPLPAQAAFPGANGRVAYHYSNNAIAKGLLDGSGSTGLTPGGGQDENPAWSPDGKKIAFVNRASPCGQEIWVMNADGTGRAPLVTAVPGGYPVCPPLDNPAWSRDGSRIVFEVIYIGGGDIARADTSGTNVNVTPIIQTNTAPPFNLDERDPVYAPNSNKIAFARKDGAARYELRTINDDGTAPAALLANPTHDLRGPNWSPGGAQLVYQYLASATSPPDWDIRTVNANGTGDTPVVNTTLTEWEPAWSPEGNMIVYSRQPSVGSTDHELYTVNPNGSGNFLFESRPASFDTQPDWQPVREAQVRPKGATPLYMQLVPAFNACASPNATHQAFGSPPQSFSSCVPPKPSSGDLTVGEPSVNGKAPNFRGVFQAKSISGDQQFVFVVEDVRCARNIVGACTGGVLSDYTGNLRLRYLYQFTDRSNPAGTAGTAAAIEDLLNVNGACTATADPAVGSTCAAAGSLNAIHPGAIVTGRRSVLQVASVEVEDVALNDFAVPGMFFP